MSTFGFQITESAIAIESGIGIGIGSAIEVIAIISRSHFGEGDGIVC
jgi:hypothetical protein